MTEKLKKILPELKEILKVASFEAKTLKFKVYLVGGMVRDLILGKEIFDLDIVVEGEAITLAKKLAGYFNAEFRKHHTFGTATIYLNKHKVDLATARREVYPSRGSLPRVKPATLREDLFRRDFTINAMAISLNKENYSKLIDFYGGWNDLKQGLIRVLHKESFLEDPTRILRAIRFEQRFGFSFEKNTFELMKEAISGKALSFVHPHRLKDELILLLTEPKPRRYIERIEKLNGFSFLDEQIKLKQDDFRLFLKIEKAIPFYRKKFKKYRRLEEWIIYLAAILIKLSKNKILDFFHNFGLKKGERTRILSIKENLSRIKRLSRKVKAFTIYRLINSLSFESILFFYAYYPHETIRRNIEYFLEELVNIRLRIKGEDLKNAGLSPFNLYSKTLKRLLYFKMNKKLKTKQEEREEAEKIFKRLLKQRC